MKRTYKRKRELTKEYMEWLMRTDTNWRQKELESGYSQGSLAKRWKELIKGARE